MNQNCVNQIYASFTKIKQFVYIQTLEIVCSKLENNTEDIFKIWQIFLYE